MFIEILFKMLLFKGGVLIYAEHCIYIYIYIYIYISAMPINHLFRDYFQVHHAQLLLLSIIVNIV